AASSRAVSSSPNPGHPTRDNRTVKVRLPEPVQTTGILKHCSSALPILPPHNRLGATGRGNLTPSREDAKAGLIIYPWRLAPLREPFPGTAFPRRQINSQRP